MTDHFRLISSLPAKQVLPVAQSLNRFESAIEIVTSAKDIQTTVPTTIHVLELSDWLYFVPGGSQVAGIFFPDKFENRILVMEPSDRMATPFTFVMHEYVHYLLSQRGMLYPRWYNEGLAEVLSASLEDETSFQIGLLKRERLGDARAGPLWIPFEQLFGIDPRGNSRHNPDYQPVFYGESTLLVHYLMFGSAERKAQLAQYLTAINRSVASKQAFIEAFQTDFKQLEEETRRYAKQRQFDSYRLPKAALAPRQPPIVRQVGCGPASVETGLALLAVHGNPYNISAYWFNGADNEGDAANWRLGKAAAALARKELPRVNTLIAEALRSPDVTAESSVRAAELLLAQVNAPLDDGRALPESDRLLVERAGGLLNKPDVAAMHTAPVAYVRGTIALRSGQDTDGALEELFQAIGRTPKNPHLAEVAALLCERKHDASNAAGAWSIVAAYSPDPAKRQQALQRLQAIDTASKSKSP